MEVSLNPRTVFPGSSEMARRMRELDWSLTDFGSPEHWPENLRVAVSICLPSHLPVLLWWGPKLNVLYNDAFLPWLTEEKHPRALARPGIEFCPEIWDAMGPMLQGVMASGTATWSEGKEWYINRKLLKEDVYSAWTYAPIFAADGSTVDGIFCPCTEIAEQVIGADVTDKQFTRTNLEQQAKERTADLEQTRGKLRALNQDLLMAQEEDRRHLSVELHDGAGQWIVALRWKLSSLTGLLGGETQPLVRGLNEALELLDSLTQELRTVSYLIHAPLLEDLGLAAALRQYTEGLFDRNGLAVNLQIDANLRRMPRDIEGTVFRIVQESLTNVHKHAKTKSATVRIWYESDGIEIVIDDKGTGIPGFSSLDSPNMRFGVGIQGMRERVRHLNGTFNLQSTTRGTVVSAKLPCTIE